jgi:hypothetical protein
MAHPRLSGGGDTQGWSLFGSNHFPTERLHRGSNWEITAVGVVAGWLMGVRNLSRPPLATALFSVRWFQVWLSFG